MFKNVLLIPALLLGLSVSSITQAAEVNTDSEQIQAFKSQASDDKSASKLKPLWERGIDSFNAKKCDIKESLHELSKKMESQFEGERLDVEVTVHGQTENHSDEEERYVCN